MQVPHPLDTLVDHYERQKDQANRNTLTEATTPEQMRETVRTRLQTIWERDPFLTDPEIIELRILKAIASALEMPIPRLLEEPPELLPEEKQFKKDFEKDPPLNFDNLETTLVKFTLTTREGISPRIRTMVARHIRNLFADSPEKFLDCLTSKIVQKFLTEDEYFFLFRHLKKESRDRLINDLIMAPHFADMDETARFVLLCIMQESGMHKRNIRRIVGQKPLTFLSERTLMELIRIGVEMKSSDFFQIMIRDDLDQHLSASIAGLNAFIQCFDEKNETFILAHLHQFIGELTENQRMLLNWRKIFEHIKRQKLYFTTYWQLFPKNTRNLRLWTEILFVAIEQDHESIVADVLSYTNGMHFDKALSKRLVQKALERGWSEATFHVIVKPR